MATLADELQNDFADSGDEDFQDEDAVEVEDQPTKRPKTGANGVDGEMDVEDDEEVDDEDDVGMEDAQGFHNEAEEETELRLQRKNQELAVPKDMAGVTKFVASMELVLQDIAHYKALPPGHQSNTDDGPVEEHPEYKLLTKSNNFSTSIDDNAVIVHKYIRDHYSARFPELETLLGDPMEYTKAVATIANGPMENVRDLVAAPSGLIGQPLNTVLSRQNLLNVTVEATTTKGQPLPDSEVQAVLSACKTMLTLEKAKWTLTDFVESRMNLFAPNLTRLIGSKTAAQLLNARGGLTALAQTPSSNLAAIGSRRLQAGLATNVGIRNQGFLYESPLIHRFRPELRKQALRIVAAKVTLAARVDRTHGSPDGSVGEDLLEQCEKRLDKLIEPPPNKGHRALPAPDDKPSKKRGGRRARKAKEATAMTEIRKAQNRMAFGKEEEEVGYGTGDTTAGLGMIGQTNEGRVRALQVDNRTRAKLSKKNAGWGGATPGGGMSSSLRGFGQGAGAGNASVLKGHGLRTSGVATSLGSATAGTASSLAFGQNRGLELADPKARAEMERRAKADQDKWFKGGTFTQVGGGSSVVQNGRAKMDGEFKMPALPVKRKADGD